MPVMLGRVAGRDRSSIDSPYCAPAGRWRDRLSRARRFRHGSSPNLPPKAGRLDSRCGPNPAGMIVTRNPAVPVNRMAALIRNNGIAGKEELGEAPVIAVFFGVAAHGNHQAVIGFLDGEPRSFIEQVIFRAQIVAVLHFFHVGIGHAKRVEAGVQGNWNGWSRCRLRRPANNWSPANALKHSGGSRERAPIPVWAVRAGDPAVPCTPRSGRRTRAWGKPWCAFCCRSGIRGARWACRRRGRPRRISSRDRRSASRTLRCVPRRGWPGDAGKLRRAIPTRPLVSRKAIRSSPSSARAPEDNREWALRMATARAARSAGSNRRREFLGRFASGVVFFM